MGKPEQKSKYPPVNKADDILDPVARFHAKQLEQIIELLEKLVKLADEERFRKH